MKKDMTQKKYEITDIAHHDHPHLKRIRALIDVPGVVKKGELGGYIESESCLSHTGLAWVYGSAKVYGIADVCSDAKVCDE